MGARYLHRNWVPSGLPVFHGRCFIRQQTGIWLYTTQSISGITGCAIVTNLGDSLQLERMVACLVPDGTDDVPGIRTTRILALSGSKWIAIPVVAFCGRSNTAFSIDLRLALHRLAFSGLSAGSSCVYVDLPADPTIASTDRGPLADGYFCSAVNGGSSDAGWHLPE